MHAVLRISGNFHFATIHGDGEQFHPKPIVAGTVPQQLIKNWYSFMLMAIAFKSHVTS